MSKPTKRLGRGLSSLVSPEIAHFAETRDEPAQPSRVDQALRLTPQGPTVSQISRLVMLPLERIRANPMQPRREFDLDQLETLAESLRSNGALQPVVVRQSGEGYELVAGERRLRAARLAEIPEIPAIVRSVPDDQLLELALIENVHRADLNPVERARAYATLHEKHDLSHDQIGERVGEDRATVANCIRLLALPGEVLDMLSSGKLTAGHAKAILSAPDSEAQIRLARQAMKESWSVRQTEREAAAARKVDLKTAPPAQGPAKRPAVADMEARFCEAVGTRVTIRENRSARSGRIVIEYYNLDDFERITRRLGVDVENS